MLAKLIIVVLTAEELLSQTTALTNCVNTPYPKWVKLNKSPVCFGAKGNSFAKLRRLLSSSSLSRADNSE